MINSLLMHRANQKLKSIIGERFFVLDFYLSFYYFHIANFGNK